MGKVIKLKQQQVMYEFIVTWYFNDLYIGSYICVAETEEDAKSFIDNNLPPEFIPKATNRFTIVKSSKYELPIIIK